MTTFAILEQAANEYRTTLNYMIKLNCTDIKIEDLVNAVAENFELDPAELKNHIVTYKY